MGSLVYISFRVFKWKEVLNAYLYFQQLQRAQNIFVEKRTALRLQQKTNLFPFMTMQSHKKQVKECWSVPSHPPYPPNFVQTDYYYFIYLFIYWIAVKHFDGENCL